MAGCRLGLGLVLGMWRMLMVRGDGAGKEGGRRNVEATVVQLQLGR